MQDADRPPGARRFRLPLPRRAELIFNFCNEICDVTNVCAQAVAESGRLPQPRWLRADTQKVRVAPHLALSADTTSRQYGASLWMKPKVSEWFDEVRRRTSGHAGEARIAGGLACLPTTALRCCSRRTTGTLSPSTSGDLSSPCVPLQGDRCERECSFEHYDSQSRYSCFYVTPIECGRVR
jgi:hypothetical protein